MKPLLVIGLIATAYFVCLVLDRNLASKFLILIVGTMMFPIVTFGVGILTCIIHAQTIAIQAWDMRAWIVGSVFGGLPIASLLSIYCLKQAR